MRDLTVIGSPTASHARALVELSFFSNGAHEEEGRAAVDVTFVLDEVPKITRITEAIITR